MLLLEGMHEVAAGREVKRSNSTNVGAFLDEGTGANDSASNDLRQAIEQPLVSSDSAAHVSGSAARFACETAFPLADRLMSVALLRARFAALVHGSGPIPSIPAVVVTSTMICKVRLHTDAPKDVFSMAAKLSVDGARGVLQRRVEERLVFMAARNTSGVAVVPSLSPRKLSRSPSSQLAAEVSSNLNAALNSVSTSKTLRILYDSGADVPAEWAVAVGPGLRMVWLFHFRIHAFPFFQIAFYFLCR